MFLDQSESQSLKGRTATASSLPSFPSFHSSSSHLLRYNRVVIGPSLIIPTSSLPLKKPSLSRGAAVVAFLVLLLFFLVPGTTSLTQAGCPTSHSPLFRSREIQPTSIFFPSPRSLTSVFVSPSLFLLVHLISSFSFLSLPPPLITIFFFSIWSRMSLWYSTARLWRFD